MNYIEKPSLFRVCLELSRAQQPRLPSARMGAAACVGQERVLRVTRTFPSIF